MEKDEIRGLSIAAIVLAFVFSYQGANLLLESILFIPVSLLVVSLGFIAHEMSHRTVAKKFGAVAKFKLWNQGLLLAVLLALISNGGFVFAAPGAVVIFPKIDLWGRAHRFSREQNGLISLSGPAANIIIAIIGYLFLVLLPGLSWVLRPLFMINLWLAIFNMIPFPPLDGHAIFSWNRNLWIAIFALAVFLLIFL